MSAADDYEKQTRSLAIDFVRDFKSYGGYRFKTQFEDDLARAVESLLDEEVVEAWREIDKMEEAANEAEATDSQASDDASDLTRWLGEVLHAVSQDDLGSTVECPSCTASLEDGKHHTDCEMTKTMDERE